MEKMKNAKISEFKQSPEDKLALKLQQLTSIREISEKVLLLKRRRDQLLDARDEVERVAREEAERAARAAREAAERASRAARTARAACEEAERANTEGSSSVCDFLVFLGLTLQILPFIVSCVRRVLALLQELLSTLVARNHGSQAS